MASCAGVTSASRTRRSTRRSPIRSGTRPALQRHPPRISSPRTFATSRPATPACVRQARSFTPPAATARQTVECTTSSRVPSATACPAACASAACVIRIELGHGRWRSLRRTSHRRIKHREGVRHAHRVEGPDEHRITERARADRRYHSARAPKTGFYTALLGRLLRDAQHDILNA